MSTLIITVVTIAAIAIGIAAVTSRLAETDFAVTLLILLVGFAFMTERKKLRADEKRRAAAEQVSVMRQIDQLIDLPAAVPRRPFSSGHRAHD